MHIVQKKSKMYTSYVPYMYSNENMLHYSNEISLYIENFLKKNLLKSFKKWTLPAGMP